MHLLSLAHTTNHNYMNLYNSYIENKKKTECKYSKPRKQGKQKGKFHKRKYSSTSTLTTQSIPASKDNTLKTFKKKYPRNLENVSQLLETMTQIRICALPCSDAIKHKFIAIDNQIMGIKGRFISIIQQLESQIEAFGKGCDMKKYKKKNPIKWDLLENEKLIDYYLA